jgi:hypothetical protein
MDKITTYNQLAFPFSGTGGLQRENFGENLDFFD